MRHSLRHPFLVPFVTLLVAAAAHAQQWSTWTTANSQLTSDTVLAACIDHAGHIWLCLGGTTDFGRLDGRNFTSFYDSVGRHYPEQVFEFQNVLWVYSADGGGVTKYDGNSWLPFSVPNDDYVTFFTSDNAGQFWTAGNGVDVLRANGRWNHFDASQPATQFPNNSLQTIATDGNGNTWCGFTFDGGVVRLNGTTGVGTYFTADSSAFGNIPTKDVCSIAVDWGGNVWCATRGTTNAGRGVYRISADGSRAQVWSTDSSYTWISNDVRTVTVDHCGNVWIGTDAGAAMFDGSRWTTFTKANSPLASDSINAIAVDGGGHLWFCTDQGLTEYKPLPQTAYPTFPANNATLTADSVTCTWAWDCPNVSRYYFEYADNANFTNSTVDSSLTSFTTNTPAKHLANLTNHATYYWRVKGENDAGYGPFCATQQFSINVTGVSANPDAMPDGLALQQNYPNPSRGETVIPFTLARQAHVSLRIYDALGREVATLIDGKCAPGSHVVSFDASILRGSGAYFYRLETPGTRVQRAMRVLR